MGDITHLLSASAYSDFTALYKLFYLLTYLIYFVGYENSR